MVAGDEERTLSVSGAVPPGLAASRRLGALAIEGYHLDHESSRTAARCEGSPPLDHAALAGTHDAPLARQATATGCAREPGAPGNVVGRPCDGTDLGRLVASTVRLAVR
jgi:hypothetical protein